MASYSQWRKLAAAGELKRVTWVGGTQRVLVEEVVDYMRSTVAASDMDYVNFLAGSVPDREIWAAANQYPMSPDANRLILVRDAEQIKRWKPLEDWLANTRMLPNVYLLFISNEKDFPHAKDKDGKFTSDLAPHIEWIKARGRMVKCSTPNEKDLVLWVQSKAEVDDRTAMYLLQRAGENLATVSNVCAKARLFGSKLSEGVIDVLCSESPAEDFVTYLLSIKKPQALMALRSMSEDEYGPVIGLLESRLELLSLLNTAIRKDANMVTWKLAQAIDAHMFLVVKYRAIAKHYDSKRQLRCRKVLALVDDALKSGYHEGVLESLVALW